MVKGSFWLSSATVRRSFTSRVVDRVGRRHCQRGSSFRTPLASCFSSMSSLFDPTEEHAALRSSLRSFVEKEVRQPVNHCAKKTKRLKVSLQSSRSLLSINFQRLLFLYSLQQVEPQADDFNRTETFNIDLFRRLGTKDPDGLGLLGLTAPEDCGGTGLVDAAAVALVHEELSYSDPAFCLSYLAHSLLLVNNLSVNANDEQRQRLLPALCDGSKIGGMCMSEPNAGTDVLGMSTTAKEESDGWLLNGTKMWITNGTLNGQDTGDVFLVYARTGPGRTDLTQFVVEKGMEGFQLGQKIHDKLGMRASMTAELGTYLGTHLVYIVLRIPKSNNTVY